MALLQMNTRSEKLEIILDTLIAKLNASDDLDVRRATAGRLPDGYFKVIRKFFKRFSAVNPDDYGRLLIIRNLVTSQIQISPEFFNFGHSLGTMRNIT